MSGFSEQLASYLDNLNRLRKVGASEDSLRDLLKEQLDQIDGLAKSLLGGA